MCGLMASLMAVRASVKAWIIDSALVPRVALLKERRELVCGVSEHAKPCTYCRL